MLPSLHHASDQVVLHSGKKRSGTTAPDTGVPIPVHLYQVLLYHIEGSVRGKARHSGDRSPGLTTAPNVPNAHINLSPGLINQLWRKDLTPKRISLNREPPHCFYNVISCAIRLPAKTFTLNQIFDSHRPRQKSSELFPRNIRR